jgi:hypothetical protein
MAEKIILQDVRCSFVFVANERKDGGFGIQPLIKKGSAQHKKIQKIVDKVLVDKFGEKALKTKGKFKLPLRNEDGDERDGEEYEGMVFLNANNGRRPGIVNRSNEPADSDDIEEYCYSGAYFHVSCNFYAFEAKEGGKPGVAVGLNNVMLRKKGDRLDGSVAATSEFADFASDEDDFEEEDDF